jgi:hypothetical protein
MFSFLKRTMGKRGKIHRVICRINLSERICKKEIYNFVYNETAWIDVTDDGSEWKFYPCGLILFSYFIITIFLVFEY